MNKTMIPILFLGMILGSVLMFVGQLALSDDDVDHEAIVTARTCSSEEEEDHIRQPDESVREEVGDDADDGGIASSPKILNTDETNGAALENSKSIDAGAINSRDNGAAVEAESDQTKKKLPLKTILDAVRGLNDDDLEKVEDVIDERLYDEEELPQVEVSADISGNVTDSFGNPVPNAKVYASTDEHSDNSGFTINIGGGLADLMREHIATTDDSGQWAATVSDSISEGAKLSVSLVAKSEGFADSKAVKVAVKDKEVKSGISITMRGAGSVSGWVKDINGVGVEGVQVGLNPATSGNNMGGIIFGDMLNSGGKYNATTDSSGFYRIEDIPEGRYKFKLKAVGIREKSGPKEITVKSGEDTKSTIDFVVEKTSSLVIKLVDSEGNPVDGWGEISLVSDNKKVALKRSLRVEDGVAEITEPPAGVYTLVIEVWGYKEKKTSVDIREGQATATANITLEEDGETDSESGELRATASN